MSEKKKVVIAVVIAEPGGGPIGMAEKLVEIRTDLLGGPGFAGLDLAQNDYDQTVGAIAVQAYANAFPRKGPADG